MSPRSLGGYNKSANYRLAHQLCNSARRNLPYHLTREVLASLPPDARAGLVQQRLREAHGIWHRLYEPVREPSSWEIGVGRDFARRRKLAGLPRR